MRPMHPYISDLEPPPHPHPEVTIDRAIILVWCKVLICSLPTPDHWHAMFIPNEGEPEPTWAEKQAFKDAFISAYRWGYECFPPEDALIDEANVYHMFVGPEPPVHL